MCNIPLQAKVNNGVLTSPFFVLLLICLTIFLIAKRSKNGAPDIMDENTKKILRGALIGWILFAVPVVACDTISWNNSLESSLLEPMTWLMSIPGALFGAIVGIISIKKEHKEQTVQTKEPETLESKIKGLKNLLDEGLLTQEEFDEQKKKILNS